MRGISDSWVRCGLIAAALGCLAVVLPLRAALATTDYYWDGGAGTWSTDSWSLSSSTTGTSNWVNSNQSIAVFGYLGTGGQDTSPALISVTTPITANSLYFYEPGEGYVYSFTGGSTITIGNGTSAGTCTCDFGANLATGYIFLNNVAVAGTQNLVLNSTSSVSGTQAYTNAYWVVNNCSFGNLVVGNAYPPTGTGMNVAEIEGTVNGSGTATITMGNVTLGAGAGLADYEPNGTTLSVGTVTISPYGGYFSGGFAQLSSNVVRIGAGADTGANSSPTLIINGPITGNGDVEFSSGFSSGGLGVVILNSPCTYTGVTSLCQYSTRTLGTAPVGLLQLGCNNALPTTTDLTFGQAGGNYGGNGGGLDLHGFNQTVSSLSSWYKGTSDYYGGITNFSSTQSTLTINDTAGTSFTYYQGGSTFDVPVGKLTIGTTGQVLNSTNNIALVLPSTNQGALVLGVALQTDQNGNPLTSPTSNTYNGGTTINGGGLYAANGLIYNSSTSSGTQNSATGTGPVVVGSGGTLGGSPNGGAVGMPSTGPVTINNGATLAPAGINWTANAAPVFHVLGNLTLNAGATVDFSFYQNADQVNVGGTLTFPTTGNVTIDVNNLGGLQNGTPIFTVSNSANFVNFTPSEFTFVDVSDTLSGTEHYTLQQAGTQIDLMAPWLPTLKEWVGSVSTSGSYIWDVNTTANFSAAGAAAKFVNSDAVVFDDTATNFTVTIAGTGVDPGSLIFRNAAHTYVIKGGPITGGGMLVEGGGSVTLENTNSFTGATQIMNNSTLLLFTSGALNVNSVVNLYDTSKLEFDATMNFGNAINFNAGSAGVGASPIIDVLGSNVVTMTSIVYSGLYNNNATIGFTKEGPGELLLTNPYNDDTGTTVIAAGTLCVNSVDVQPGQSYSALGSGNVKLQGGTLWLANVAIGVEQNQTTDNLVGYIDLYSGSTLQATGTSSFSNNHVSAVLNFNGSYSPGSGTLAATAGSTLTLMEEVRQYDPNYESNEYGNWVGNGATGSVDTTKLFTMHVTGGGVVKLQAGGVASEEVFGGAWSVDSGILQVGPFIANPTPSPASTSTGWGGPYGEPINALGFHTPNGQVYPGVAGDPDLPNAVTVNSGGILAVAVDQVNGNPNNMVKVNGVFTDGAVNSTPTYLRNPITLNGGAIASTGYEVTFGASNGTDSSGNPTSTNPQGMPDSTLVVAQFGGSLTVNSGTSQVLTYDPVGSTGARQVDLVGGTRTLSNSSVGWAAGSTIVYSTSWVGTLQVNPGTTTGGVFAISRTGGNTSIGPNAALQILSGAGVDLLGNVAATGTSALTDNQGSGNSVAVSNSGTLNVQTTGYTLGSLNTSGVLGLSAGVTLTAGSLGVSGGTLNYTLGSGTAACSFLNVSGGAVSLPGSGVILNLSNGGGLGVGVYPLLSFGTLSPSYTSAFTMGSEPSSVAGDTFSFTTSGNDLDLVISGVVVNGIWKTNGSGTWSTTSNWTGGVPGSGQDTAVFGSALTTGTATVTLDSSRSLSSLGFSTTGTNSYAISPSNGSTLTLANMAGSATVSDSGGSHTIAVPIVLGSNLSVSATTGSSLTVSGPISQTGGSQSLSFSGGGELILSGTNTYSGGSNLTAGVLQVNASSTVASGALASGPLGVGAVNLSGGTFQGSGGPTLANAVNISGSVALANLTLGPQTLSTPNTVTLTAGPTINVTSPVTIADAVSGNLVMAGPSTLTLTAASNSLTGTTQVSGGTLVGTAANIATPVALANSANVTYNQQSSGTLSQVVSGNGSLTLAGGAVLAVTASNTYSGLTTINSGGTLQIGNGGTTGSINNTSGVTDNGLLAFDLSSSMTFSKSISGNGGLKQAASSALCLTSNNTYTGATTITAGTLQLGNGTTAGSISAVSSVSDNGTLVFDLPTSTNFANAVSGAGVLVQAGAGVVTLTGSNNYTGGTTVSQGTLEVADPGALPTTGIINVGRSGTVSLLGLLVIPTVVGPDDSQASLETVAEPTTSTLVVATVPVVSEVAPPVVVAGGTGVIGRTPADGLTAVPEPGTLALLLAGAAALAAAAWWRSRLGR